MIRACALGVVISVAVTLVAPTAGWASDAPPLSATRLLNKLGLTLGEQVAVEEGKLVTRDIERRLDNELAAVAVTRTPASIDAVRAMMFCDPGASPPRVAARTGIRVPLDEADWRGVGFSDADFARLDDLLGGGPSEALNLSAAEADQLRGLSGPDLGEAYRSILMSRVDAYANRGLAGISPYARRDGESSPAHELGSALEATTPLLQGSFPQVAAALAGPPMAAKGVEQRFSWSRPNIDGQTAVVLTHEVIDESGMHCLLAQRQFFVSHTYNSLQSVTLAVPSGDGSLIVRIGRTYTDRVAGPFSGMEKKVGQKMIRESLGGAVQDIAGQALSVGGGNERAARPAPG